MIVGMMWNRNEGDILAEIITSAMNQVEILYFADDGSVDNSWDIVANTAQRFYKDRLIIQREPNKNDPGQRQALLNKIRERHKPQDSWIQVIESDIMILDTRVEDALKFAVNDIAVCWQTLNAVRKAGTWKEVDTYPHWDKSIKGIMPLAHRIEAMVYTYRPLPDLYYNPGLWRPWPSGFSKYSSTPLDPDRREPDSPLLAHYGFRGLKHFKKKYANMGRWHRRYATWDLSSLESIEATVPYFNGQWTNGAYPMSREGWAEWLKQRREARSGS
jgi:glycosyltransferase involved in cell wall biosynthesis